MSLFDRLKPTPRWKHADPQVRLAAVPEIDSSREDAATVLAELATTDMDPRVRRAAVSRVDDPHVLSDVVRSDADDQVRGAALTFESLFFVGLLLFLMTLTLNLASEAFVRRVRRQY